MNNEFDRGAWAMVDFFYNVGGDEFAAGVFGEDAHPSYLHEKALAYAKSPARTIGYLDAKLCRKFLDMVRARADSDRACICPATKRYQ